LIGSTGIRRKRKAHTKGTKVAELIDKGFDVRRQVPIPIKYKNLEFDEGFRADLIVENIVLVELKASETNHPVYYRQPVSYLKLSSIRFGLL